jgi:crotonobetainyl-CoA:carnitine CoA-transferase CaiB-like acyl-CoA transferase
MGLGADDCQLRCLRGGARREAGKLGQRAAGNGSKGAVMRDEQHGPLQGVRVLDLTGVVMGPWATQALGDMGADVIKIEPEDGDVMRFLSPSRHDSMSPSFLNFNRNKRSVALDLKSPRGKGILLKLARLSDVFVSNVRPQAMRRLGLDYEALQRENARIIYCGCYGYGENGPYAGRAAVDDTIQAASGLAWLQGYRGSEPRYVNAIVADKVVGLYAAQAIAMALYAREKTGRGQFIEVPMFETMAAFVVPEHLSGLTYEPPLGAAGYERLLNPYRKPFKTKDGHIAVVPYNDQQWARFFKIADREDLLRDPRYATVLARSSHFPELYRFIEETLGTRTTAEWADAFAQAELPFALVNSFDALLKDPHLAATGFWHEVEHPTEGATRMAGIPVKLSDTPGSIRRPAPNLGEHTVEVLRELGIE